MNLTPIAIALARAFRRQPMNIESAAWLWFQWTRLPNGALSYRWLV